MSADARLRLERLIGGAERDLRGARDCQAHALKTFEAERCTEDDYVAASVALALDVERLERAIAAYTARLAALPA